MEGPSPNGSVPDSSGYLTPTPFQSSSRALAVLGSALRIWGNSVDLIVTKKVPFPQTSQARQVKNEKIREKLEENGTGRKEAYGEREIEFALPSLTDEPDKESPDVM